MTMRRILCLLLLSLPALGQEWAGSPSRWLVRVSDPSSPTLTWAADRIVFELQTVHRLPARVEAGGYGQFNGAGTDTGVLVLGRLGASKALTEWGRLRGVDFAARTARPDGYCVLSEVNPARVIITATNDVGVWYGACAWLDALREASDGRLTMPCGELVGAPTLAHRFTRGLIPRKSPSRIEESISWLDWWARWRLNVTGVGRVPDSFLNEFLTEAHRRGIRVLRGLGVRNLCAADDLEVARCADEFRAFLKLGGDGVSMLWDDLPHDRCYGHCECCRTRFGTNSLPHEIVRVLEALTAVADASPRRPLIVWCPPHYSENRYPELSDEDFFRVIGRSQKVRQQTHLYHCEFDSAKTAILDRHGLTNRIWWYNGLRTLYHVSHHWPSPPGVKLTIPGIKSFEASDFAPFEVGWKTGYGVRSDGTLIPAPPRTWQQFRSLPARYQGYYPCTATHPYHAAVGGLFAFDPGAFDQAEADRTVFRAMFGPGSAEAARAWSAAYTEWQIRLAQTNSGALSLAPNANLSTQMAPWRALSREIETRSAQGRSLLTPSLSESVLARMREAENAVARIASRAGVAESSSPR